MFIQRYINPTVIGVADNVRYKGKDYQVLINYIKGETDAKNYTPKSNRTILIDENSNRVICDNYKLLEILTVKHVIYQKEIVQYNVVIKN